MGPEERAFSTENEMVAPGALVVSRGAFVLLCFCAFWIVYISYVNGRGWGQRKRMTVYPTYSARA